MTTRTTRSDGIAPSFRHLNGETSRALILHLRSAAAPILGNSIHPHFTDHTVFHSDNVVDLVDSLIDNLQGSKQALNDDELIVLYSSCYLHDIGMQLEAASDSRVIQNELGPLRAEWQHLPEATRREILRRNHHLISAELVADSQRAVSPQIGIALEDRFHPAEIARLCEAHCVAPSTARYDQLMEDSPRIRMRLLSGLLRMADILDETRHRAYRQKARTLQLNLESETHWWRHYYTRDVVIEERRIVLWFEFPNERVNEYQKVVPQLQCPWIEDELSYHRDAFSEAGLGWKLCVQVLSGLYQNVEQMPDGVLMEMLKELHRRTLKGRDRAKLLALNSFNESRPLIERRLEAVRESRPTLSSDDYIQQLAAVAFDLVDIGGRRSGWIALNGQFSSLYLDLSIGVRVKIGTQLLCHLIEDGVPDVADQWIRHIAKDIDDLRSQGGDFQEPQRVLAEAYTERFALDEAEAALAIVARNSPCLRADLAEVHFLRGHLDKAIQAGGEANA